MTFTDKPPTEPGFYAWKPNSGGHEDLVTVYEDHLGGLMTIGTAMSWPDREPPAVKAGLWCRLVPAEEARLLREQIRVADVAFQGLFEEHKRLKRHFAEEVEKAFFEGWDKRSDRTGGLPTQPFEKVDWLNSRARRVATGEEQR